MNMIKELPLRLNQCFGLFTMLPVDGSSQLDFLDIYLATFSEVRNFGNTYAMIVIFVWKCSKFDVSLKNANENLEKVFCFFLKCIWIVCIKLSLLRREYILSAVNVLTKSPKTLHVPKSDFFQLNYFHIDKRIW